MSDQRPLLRRPTTLLVGAGVLVVAAILAFGVFGVQTLFIDKTVDEDNPFADASVTAPAAPTESASATSAEEPSPTQAPTEPPAESSTQAPVESATESPTPPPSTAAPGVVTVAQGSFSGADASHDVSGQALVLTDGSEQRFLRFEDFEATNGPDLKVYLRAADGQFVSLGDLKGNIGNQNYEVPADVDLGVYNTVQIWCKRFSVNFGQAELA